jgi:hypothetical protein
MGKDVIEGLWNELQETKQQRDELLNALESLVKNYEYNKCKGLGLGPLFKAKQAIAKAKEVEG